MGNVGYIKKSEFPFRENIVLAEKVFDYFKHSAYKDLLNFERDLAELSDLTVIISESPGSIAELGSFAVLEKVQERLLVVMHRDDFDKESFIWRGPILYLKELAKNNGQEDPITIYDWNKKGKDDDSLTEMDFSDAEDLAEIIKKILSKLTKTKAFNRNQLGHVMLLMLDLLKIIQLATLEEITNILNLLEIDHDRRNVEKHLSLLISLNFAVKQPYGNNVYYISSNERPWLSLAFTKTARIRDLERWNSEFIEYYSQKQKQKFRALRSYMRSAGLIGD